MPDGIERDERRRAGVEIQADGAVMRLAEDAQDIAGIGLVGGVDRAVGRDGKAKGRAAAETADRIEPAPLAIQLADAAADGIRHVDDPGGIDGDAVGGAG